MLIYLTILLILALFFYRCYWEPKKRHQWYVENFRKQGYKVLEVPFRPLAITFLKIYDLSPNTKDAMRVPKETYPQYDVCVMNTMNKVYINLIHPDLIQDFYLVENLENYAKNKSDTANMKRGLGEGITFSEGKTWKMKRNVLNSMFNFDFLKSLTSKIAVESNYVLDLMDK